MSAEGRIVDAYVAVGSNVDPGRSIPAALRDLAARVRVTGLSTFYRTEPVGPAGQPPFANGVLRVATDLPPGALRSLLREVEARAGRRRTDDPYAPRTIDLDLVLHGDLRMARDGLVLPDPAIAKRPFLAFPLLEIDPDLRLPGARESLREAARRLDVAGMVALPEMTRGVRAAVWPAARAQGAARRELA